MSSKKTEIMCSYCDCIWDYSANDCCPYCGAAPELEQIDKANKREIQQIRQKTEAEAIKNPGKALSTWVASKTVLWAVLLVALLVLPFIFYCIMSSLPKLKPSVELQVVDEAEVVKHAAGTEFNVTDYLSVNVPEPRAVLLKDSSIEAFIPENYTVLIIKVSAESDGENHSFYTLSKEENAVTYGVPYIIADNVAYTPISANNMDKLSVEEPELKNIVEIDPDYSITALSGYICYIVPKDISTCTICFEAAHYTKMIRYLDRIHTVELAVEEAE